MAYSEDHIALAAEYALGTLDADERAQADILMAVDPEFTAIVRAWEYRLGALNQMVGSVEPRPVVWENIKAAIGGSTGQQASQALPEAPTPPEAPQALPPEVAPASPAEAVQPLPSDAPPSDTPAMPPPDTPAAPVAAEIAPVVAGQSDVVQLSGRARRWRNVASFATAIAAALIAMLAMQVYQPDLLPNGLRPKPRIQTVEVKVPAPPPTASGQYVALLQRDGGSPAFILTVDATTRNFTVRKVGGDAEAGKSFELWLISDRLPQPRSLGVIGGSEFTARPVLADYDANTIRGATFAVTVEQAGGSPDGKPHSAPIFTGRLIETVPSAAAPR
jgi:anti-sigma-K factor RskA